MSRRQGLAFVLSTIAAPALAQGVVTSPAPDSVDVTVYREPGRAPGDELDLDWLEGYALISETRRITIPAGESDIRFEGVAGGIQPQSAIVTGLPDGIVERNRDALLLSPGTLLDRSLGRRVHLRRTSRATGAMREQQAVIRTGADGAVVLQTADGFEALRCTGLDETLAYESVPADLSARPTLSVRTRAAQPVTATVTLSYLADGFDWQANYVAQLSSDGTRVDLFAWLTLASMDETSFPNADTQAVAGLLNRESTEPEETEASPIRLQCWPQGRTSDIPADQIASPQARRDRFAAGRGAPAAALDEDASEQIVLTGTRIARRETLGDLKLYRIPEPVTVAANSQKQVALLEQGNVRADFVYRARIYADDGPEETGTASLFLITRNRTEEGLGLPLPGGRLTLFGGDPTRPILMGQGEIRDRAVGEDVEVDLGERPGVYTRLVQTESGRDRRNYRLTVTNDNPHPVRFEASFGLDDDFEFRPRTRLPRRDGRPLWAVAIPANGSATFAYRIVERDD